MRRAERAQTELGEVLEAARKRLYISQAEAARRAGFSASTWGNMIHGGVRLKVGLRPITPDNETVAAAAAAVGLDVSEVLGLHRGPGQLTLAPPPAFDLSKVPTDVLLAALRERLTA